MSIRLEAAARAVMQAAALVLPLSTAMAADLYGGGTGAHAAAYVGDEYLTVTPPARLSTMLGNAAGTPASYTAAPITPTSVFGTYAALYGHGMSYCQSGFGIGLSVLSGATASSNSCFDYSLGSLGFSAPQASFVATDVPVGYNTYSAFQAGPLAAQKTALVQVPALMGAVILPYNIQGYTGTLNLSVSQVCAIFSGTVTSWNQVGLNLPSKPIKIVYRGDSNGTTLAFTTFLANRCNWNNGGPIPNRSNGTAKWQASTSYADAFGAIPAATYAVPVGYNVNVFDQVLYTDGAIGYADPGEIAWAPGANPPNKTWAWVDGYDPMTFASPVLAAADLLTGQVLGGASQTTGVPTTSNAPTNVTDAMVLVRPSLSASNGYPIYSVSYLTGYSAGNGTSGTVALQGLMRFMHGRTYVGRPPLPAGYDYIKVDTRDTTAWNKVGTAIGWVRP